MVKIRTGINIEEDLLKKAKYYAIYNNLTVSKLIEQALINRMSNIEIEIKEKENFIEKIKN